MPHASSIAPENLRAPENLIGKKGGVTGSASSAARNGDFNVYRRDLVGKAVVDVEIPVAGLRARNSCLVSPVLDAALQHGHGTRLLPRYRSTC